jgi:hypothetical protein
MKGVAFVTPTMNRPELHERLYQTFKSQTVSPKRLYVLDESKERSPFFGGLRDPQVVYSHRPGAFRRADGVNSIGAVRNALNSMVKEKVVLHLDDDDQLHPDYGKFMVRGLGEADLAKLDVWRIITDTDPALILEWDTRQFGGEHFALMGDEIKKTDVDPDSMPPEVVQMFRDGYGFSYVYLTDTWRKIPFPETGTEDFPWLQAVRDAGGKINFISDGSHLILHLVSKRSKSGVYPQKIVGTADAPPRPNEAALKYATRKMMGLAAAMQEIVHEGDKFAVKPGVTYSVLVSLSDKHTIKTLSAQASKWGVTVKQARDQVQPSEFGVQAPATGYRLVHVTATTDKEAQVPWEVPPPINAFDNTRVVKAWQTGTGMVPAHRGLGAAITYPITSVTPLCGWFALPSGQDIGVKAGYFYSGIASVSKSYSQQDIVSAMGSGFVLLDYGEQGQVPSIPVDPDTNHRMISLTARALVDGNDIPWSSPWPTTIFSISQAWYSPSTESCSAPPPSPLGTAVNPFVVPALVATGVVSASVGAYLLWWKRLRARM